MLTNHYWSILLPFEFFVFFSPNSAIEVQTALQINAMDMVELHAPHFPNVLHAVNRPPGFATDSDISGVLPGTERTLKPVDNSWMEPLPSGSGSGQMGGLGSSSRGKKWDQFEANEKLYGVKASFDENLYTTQLDKKTLTWNQQCKAERMAWEIESKESHNPHMREERNQAYDKVRVCEQQPASSNSSAKFIVNPLHLPSIYIYNMHPSLTCCCVPHALLFLRTWME